MTQENKNGKIRERSDVPQSDCWDLSKLFVDDPKWEEGLKEFEKMMSKIESFKGTLGESAEKLKACLEFDNQMGMFDERLGYYAQLRKAENGGDSESQGRMARYMNVASRCHALSSYQTPEIQAIPDDKMKQFLESDILEEFVISLKKILRYKPHVLSEKEELLLAMQAEFSQTAEKAFSSLVDIDLDYGEIDTPDGKKPLTQSTYGSFILDQDRDVRKTAYKQLLSGYEQHKNTLANLFNGSVLLDIFGARVRKYKSAIDASLFSDDVPVSVYDNLIKSVHDNLDTLYKYYEIRRRVLKLDNLHLYDCRVPLVAEVTMRHTYDEAVELTIKALNPLGDNYTSALKDGLTGRWVDRYENKGKQSGAFSAGSYVGDPYILMNYKNDVFNDVFTLAHEAGHSMHSWYSVRNNPFQHYNYTIFVAEVASTFNEQLLAKYMMDSADNDQFKAYLINKQIDDIIGTIFRQTMFAEFEKITHEMVENNQPLTVDSCRNVYQKLLELYFGSKVKLEDTSNMEGLRIPHFYHAFYVYKYATGMSAAIALSQRVLNGGKNELDQYINFLKSGGSKYPLELLADAGVDMASPEPINAALDVFKSLVDELDSLLK
ncbi:MAG: oligoendopeptidase F [Candidatus Anammoxibacter sp.]